MVLEVVLEVDNLSTDDCRRMVLEVSGNLSTDLEELLYRDLPTGAWYSAVIVQSLLQHLQITKETV